ncbi:hypothetical protein K505DRAFT_214330, partial [Melanomma pulvis-pyrius CBS 109.77]
LLRHEREVHKMHSGGAKKPCFCPFAGCRRSSSHGRGFTRKENLAEHVRRVHRSPSMSTDICGPGIHRDSSIVHGRRASESPHDCGTEDCNCKEPSLKRKRRSDSPDRADEDLRAMVKKLCDEREDQNARLRQLECDVAALQQ